MDHKVTACYVEAEAGMMCSAALFRIASLHRQDAIVTVLSADALAALAKYDTPTICNAIELFDIRPREVDFTDERIKACFPKLPPMVGYASTATFRSFPTPTAGGGYSSLSTQIEQLEAAEGPQVVVFQDLDDPVAAATFGEVMCTTYKAFGAVGLVTSGAGRDLDQVEAIDFPVFTNGTIASHGNCHFPTLGEVVTIGRCTIRPGDLLHGDLNGITIVPPEIATEVPGVCQEVMDAEQIILDYVRGESVTAAGFAEVRAASGEALNAIAKRLQG